MRVVAEDERLIIVDKPAGMPTQPDPGGDPSLLDAVAAHLGHPVEVAHRLDRPVSGLVVFGKSRSVTAWLGRCLRQRSIGRGYLAVVHAGAAPALKTIDEPIRKLRQGVMQVHATGRPARTHLRCLGYNGAAEQALLAARLETGRTHQLRVHLSWAVGAIHGDRKYGAITPGPRVALHAAVLTLPDRDAGQRVFTAPPPADFWPDNAGSLRDVQDWETPLRELLVRDKKRRSGRPRRRRGGR